MQLSVTVTSSQPLEWSAELWGIVPGTVYHVWNTPSQSETCTYQIVGIPDLIAVQRESYNRLLQMDVPPEKREDLHSSPLRLRTGAADNQW